MGVATFTNVITKIGAKEVIPLRVANGRGMRGDVTTVTIRRRNTAGQIAVSAGFSPAVIAAAVARTARKNVSNTLIQT